MAKINFLSQKFSNKKYQSMITVPSVLEQ